MVRLWRFRRGFEAWHVARVKTRTWEALWSPCRAGQGAPTARRSARKTEGVRLPHSTLRRESRSHGEGGNGAVQRSKQDMDRNERRNRTCQVH